MITKVKTQPRLFSAIITAQTYLNLDPIDMAKSCGMGLTTWYARRKNLDNMTLGELKQLRKLTGLDREAFLNALDV